MTYQATPQLLKAFLTYRYWLTDGDGAYWLIELPRAKKDRRVTKECMLPLHSKVWELTEEGVLVWPGSYKVYLHHSFWKQSWTPLTQEKFNMLRSL